ERSARVEAAMWDALLAYGQPDAMSRYFKHQREAKIEASRSWGAVGFYRPLIAGQCRKCVCSPRFNESLQIVTRNLNVVDSELQAAEVAPPENGTPAEVARHNQIRSAAHELRAQVARIRRGEAAIVLTQQQ